MIIRTKIVAATAALAAAAGIAAVAPGAANAAPNGCDVHQSTIAHIETPSSSASICRWQGDGRTEYRGFGKGNGLAVTAPVVWSNGASYSAVNNGYTYRLDVGRGLAVIAPNGYQISYEPAL
ncbi:MULTISPECIES: hypothetical protein [Tsukamurella]|uniref:Streptomyces killer toxin-like beta/gamma crystallin domain-containing protein n=2 Tax=Tsukamurella TaxID=2060 RepID=A0A5C5S609_9ACTN|nr:MULTISPECIES: hypothetical protein [Tsukamurella]NMD55394.1 hypothetical protein [Tsukamurella columbiensis]TWS30649.1 hypothetical protein FK530_01915 [Tsukamurella conjunctivitidis]